MTDFACRFGLYESLIIGSAVGALIGWLGIIAYHTIRIVMGGTNQNR